MLYFSDLERKGLIMKKLFLFLLLALPLLAENLHLKEGFVAAHTEMMMDSTIDPLSNVLTAQMSIQNDDITTMKGTISVEMDFFSSDNSDRDEHMDEATETAKFPLATYTVEEVSKAKDEGSYTLKGTLDFHGQKKALAFNSEIIKQADSIVINATSTFLMSDYGIEPPCMMFLCVRDSIDLFAKAVLIK